MRRFEDALELIEGLEKSKKRGGLTKIFHAAANDPYANYSYIVKFTKPQDWSEGRFIRAALIVHWGHVLGSHGTKDMEELMTASFIDDERSDRKAHKKGVEEKVIVCRLTSKDAFNKSMDVTKAGIRLLEKDLHKWLVEVMMAARETDDKKHVYLSRQQSEPFMNNPIASALWNKRYGDQTWRWSGGDSICVNVDHLKRNLGGCVPKI